MIMDRRYKESGIEWIGMIPGTWEVCRFKNLHDKANVGESIDKEFCTDNPTDTVFYTAGIKPIHTTYNDFPEWKYVNSNDLLLARNGTPYVYLPIIDAVYSDHIIRTPIKSIAIKDYVRYCLQQAISNIVVDTVSIATWSVSVWDKQYLPFPPLTVQQRIADYLDKKCGKIDSLIALQEQMIEKLKAYKQSVVTEAVTKGLNPDVEFVYSGIDWIGDVPKHWGTPSISYLASISSGSTPDRNHPEYWNDGVINWIKTGELQNKKITDSEEKVTEYALNNTSIKLYPQNTILIAMYGQGKTRGMTALLDVPSTTNQACAALSTFNKSINYLYLWKCLIAAYNAIRDMAVGTGQPNLNIDLISKFVIPLPPYEEQMNIVEYIDHIVPKIDSLIAIKQQKIETLKDYKKSVIYEAVTGKIDLTP